MIRRLGSSLAGLLGQPLLAPADAALRSLLLWVALMLAVLPLAQLFTGTTWWVLIAAVSGAVLAVNALARAVIPRVSLIPLVQLIGTVAVVLAIPLALGLITPAQYATPGELGGLGSILVRGVMSLSESIPPLIPDPTGLAVIGLATALVTLALDLILVDLGWHTAVALLLMAMILLPAAAEPGGGPWWSALGPLAAGLLILTSRSLLPAPRPRTGSGRGDGDARQRPSAPRRRLLLAASALTASGAVLALTGPVSARLPRPRVTRYPIDLDVINAWRGQATEISGVMIDDTISVRRNLLRGARQRLLTYTAQAPAETASPAGTTQLPIAPTYLRMTTLDIFDGTTFSYGGLRRGWSEQSRSEPMAVSYSIDPATGTLVVDAPEDDPFPNPMDARPSAPPDPTLPVYAVKIDALRSTTLPVPFPVRHFGPFRGLAVGEQPGIINPPDPADVIAPSVGPPVLDDVRRELDGLQYDVQADRSRPTDDVLRQVTWDDVAEYPTAGLVLIERHPVAEAQARAVLREAGWDVPEEGPPEHGPGPLDAALALTAWFHSAFDYSLTARSRSDEDPLTAFLEDRIGYCEQFAAAFAVMMSRLGAPTRVVIGFTGGTRLDAADGSTYEVTNHHAHAWPETWFGAELGWIRFEPTPPSGAGNGAALPGDEVDAPADAAPSASDLQQPPQPSPTATPDSPTDTPSSPASSAETTPAQTPGAPSDTGGDSTAPSASSEEESLPTGALALAGGAGLLVAGGAGAWWLRRRAMVTREESWEALIGQEHAEASTDGGTEGAPRARIAREAAALAEEELAEALRARGRSVSLLGWTGRWGRPAAQLEADAALAPAPALTALLARAREAGHPVSPETDSAAARLGDLIAWARYAPPSAPAPTTVEQARADLDRLRDLFSSRPHRPG